MDEGRGGVYELWIRKEPTACPRTVTDSEALGMRALTVIMHYYLQSSSISISKHFQQRNSCDEHLKVRNSQKTHRVFATKTKFNAS
jgi:hypothetical protein